MPKAPAIMVAFVAALLAAAAPGSADAYWWNGVYGADIGALYRSLEYKVPYFAAHPPVYYSAPVPRTYGYSPFAYPPGTRTPDIVPGVVQPVEIINPYVPSSTEQAPTGDQGASQRKTRARTIAQPAPVTTGPLVIENPYFHEAAKRTL